MASSSLGTTLSAVAVELEVAEADGERVAEAVGLGEAVRVPVEEAVADGLIAPQASGQRAPPFAPTSTSANAQSGNG